MPEPIDDIVKISPDGHQGFVRRRRDPRARGQREARGQGPLHTNPENVNYLIKVGTLRLIEPNGSTMGRPSRRARRRARRDDAHARRA